MNISIPHDRTFLSAELPDSAVRAVLAPHATPTAEPATKLATQETLVEAALDAPIGEQPLEALARGARNAVVITSDHTRPVPSHITLPAMVRRMRAGNPDIDISILVATGCHRATTTDELRAKLGAALADEFIGAGRLFVHDCEDESMLVTLGRLPSGAPLRVNRLAAETELLVADGFIEPHFFAGFSGGRKSVLPGICARRTVMSNHCAAFISDPAARTGVLDGNPIHKDMVFAAKRIGLRFVLNVVLAPDKTIRAAFAGDAVKAHLAGCELVGRELSVEAVPADIVITSNGGYPLDQNLYQAVKGMTAAEACCREGSTIVMVAGCADGIGGESFRAALSAMESPASLLGAIARVPAEETQPDQWQYQILARILARFRVVLVSEHLPRETVRAMGMDHARTLSEGIAIAASHYANPTYTVIPDGIGVIVR